MNKLVIPFNENSVEEIDLNENRFEVTWDELLPELSRIVKLRNDENIDGVVLSDDQIFVKVSRKRGRKIGKESAVNLNGE